MNDIRRLSLVAAFLVVAFAACGHAPKKLHSDIIDRDWATITQSDLLLQNLGNRHIRSIRGNMRIVVESPGRKRIINADFAILRPGAARFDIQGPTGRMDTAVIFKSAQGEMVVVTDRRFCTTSGKLIQRHIQAFLGVSISPFELIQILGYDIDALFKSTLNCRVSAEEDNTPLYMFDSSLVGQYMLKAANNGRIRDRIAYNGEILVFRASYGDYQPAPKGEFPRRVTIEWPTEEVIATITMSNLEFNCIRNTAIFDL